jgi:hypothetical protein
MTLVELSPPARPSIRRSSWLVRAFVAGTFLTASSTAWARPEFPGVVQEELGGCAPPCTICHTTPNPEDESTATQPFADNLYAWKDPSALFDEAMLRSLLALEASGVCPNAMDAGCVADGGCMGPCDANNNGKSDIEDLETATDPNPGARFLACPKYGCGARIAPARGPVRPLDGATSLLALGAVCMLVRRWRRR